MVTSSNISRYISIEINLDRRNFGIAAHPDDQSMIERFFRGIIS